MLSPEELTPQPSSVQEGVINSQISSLLLSMLLLGIYTVVYFGTVYLYSTSKSSRHWVVLGSISALYVSFLMQMSIQWYFAKWVFVENGQNRETVFNAVFVVPNWVTLVNYINYFLTGSLADGLLIWRCFNVWNRSLRAILLPSFLLLTEIVVYLSAVILIWASNFNPSHSQVPIFEKLIVACLFITLAITVISTILISYRIYSMSSHNILHNSRRRFQYIVDILVQSAAAYSLVTIAYAIASIIPFLDLGNDLVLRFSATAYTTLFYAFIAGVAPTIMVARFVTATGVNRNTSVIIHISDLQFPDQAPAQNVAQSRRDDSQIGSEILDLPQEPENLGAKEGGTSLGA